MNKIKTCAKHGIEYTRRCKPCQTENCAAYRLANKARIKAYQAAHYAKKTTEARQKRRKAASELPSMDVNAPAHVLISTVQKESLESPLEPSLKKKKCAKCKEPKLLDEFSRRKHTKDGREFRCKTCRNGENMARTERERVEGPRSDLHYGSNVITHLMEHSSHRHGTSKPAGCGMSPLEWV